MLRIAFMGLLAYLVGGPKFDGYRPPVLGPALVELHRGINEEIAAGAFMARHARYARYSARGSIDVANFID